MKEFEFVDSGLKFFCSVEVPGKSGMPPWWWFRVDTGTTTRYAPFEASPAMLRKAGVELGTTYPHPIVEHGTAREAALRGYDAVKAAT